MRSNLRENHKFIFGIFRAGDLLFPVGNGMPVDCTHAQADFIVRLIEPAIEPTLEPGDYVAYDYAS